MTTEEVHLERNTKRLLSAALGGEARPGAEVLSRTLKLLTRQLRPQPAAFPDTALAVMGCLLFIVAAWFAARDTSPESITAALTYSSLGTFLLVFNVIVMPFAGFVIIMRRRRNV